MLSLIVAAAGQAAAQERPAQPPRPALPVQADRDGDKVFDDLEAKLARTAVNAAVPVIVTLTAPATGERLRRLKARAGEFGVGRRFSLVDGFSTTLRKGQVEALKHVPWVQHVELDAPIRSFNAPAQQAFGVTKARADAPALDGDGDGNRAAYTPADLVAAVIDTGIDPTHVDLDGGKVLAFKDFVNGRTTAYDDNGHGTHVAGTIAGDGDGNASAAGVAPAAGLVGVKVLDAAGSGSMSDVAAALDWVVANKDAYGIEVVNLSLGASGCADGTDAASQAVNRAAAAGLVVAVAAGNEGPGTCTVGSPAAAAEALTVGAMADLAAAGFALASFSSRGPTADGRVKPDVVAPGVAILSAQANTTSGHASQSGTSMATPFVAGVALLMRDANSGLSPQQVKDAIKATAIDWGRGGNNRSSGTRGADTDYGAGRLDAYAALKSAGAPLTTGPDVPAHELREGSLTSGGFVDYKLSVTDTSVPIAATLIIPGITSASASTPDFDLYLFDPAGARVASSERVERQEAIGFKPTTVGTYTLRIASYTGAGDFFVDVSAGLHVDTVAPLVSSLTPQDGATGVSATTNVAVAFNEPMNRAATQSAFRLTDSGGATVSGAFTWSGNALIFDPTANLAAGGRYTATVSAAAEDVAGNALATPTTWSFTVAIAAVTVSATPYATAIYAGSLRSGDASRLVADDGLFYGVNSTTSGTRASDWYARIGGVANGLAGLSVTYAGKASASCEQSIYAYKWTTGAWTRIHLRTVGTTEVASTAAVGGALADYVSGTSGDGDVAVRVRCVRGDGVNFHTSGDLLKVTFTK